MKKGELKHKRKMEDQEDETSLKHRPRCESPDENLRTSSRQKEEIRQQFEESEDPRRAAAEASSESVAECVSSTQHSAEQSRSIKQQSGEQSGDTLKKSGVVLAGPAEFGRLQGLLADTLVRKYNKIDMWSWDDIRVAVPMDDIYVDLVWLKTKQGVKGRKQEHLGCYTEVFTEILPGKRGQLTYLTGEPGVGKSTITRKISVDWGKVVLGQKVDNTSGEKVELNRFKFVIPILLRDITDGQTLSDAIKEQLNLTRKDADTLCELIDQNQECTLFLLDGYDEYKETTSEEMTHLAHRRHLPYCNVFITSRHSSATHFRDTTDVPDCELSLRGFTPTGIKQYINKFFGEENREEPQDTMLNESSDNAAEDTVDSKELLDKIQESEELKHLSRYPALLLMMCSLWKEAKSLATTVTGFYLDFAKYMCCRYEKKSIPSEKRHEPAEMLQEYHRNLMEIGDVASEGIMEDKLELTFPYRKVKNSIDKTTWELGFLKEELDTQRRVSFGHKTVQEFFMSYRLVNLDQRRQNDFLLHLCSSAKAIKESSMLLTFLSGLGGEDIKNRIEDIIYRIHYMPEIHSDLQLNYLSENMKADIVLRQEVRLEITDKYPASVYVKFLSMSGENVEKFTLYCPKGSNLRLLQHLSAPSLTSLTLESSDDDGGSCFVDEKYMTQELGVTVANFPLKSLGLTHLNWHSTCGQKLTERINDGVCFEDDPPLDDDGDEDDTSPYLLSVIRALPHIPTLEELEFDSTPMTKGAVDALAECLPKTRLVKLTIYFSYLETNGFMSLLDILPDCPTLKHLHVPDNPLDSDMRKLVNKTEKLSGLSTLDLGGSCMYRDVDDEIKQALAANCPELQLKL